MLWSFTIARLFGIQIRMHVTFLLLVGWVALNGGLFTGHPGQAGEAVLFLLLLFCCVVLHELGHALTARRYGIATRDIILLPIGGVARLERMPERPSQELLVAVAGPAVNVALALLVAGLMKLTGHSVVAASFPSGVLDWLLAVNLVMILFNMIPAFPMDGGRVLRSLLAMHRPYADATRIASIVGQGFALLMAAAGLLWGPLTGGASYNPSLLLIALFVFWAAGEERQMVQARTSLSGLPVRAAMITEFHTLDARDSLRLAVQHLMSGSQQDFPVLEAGEFHGLLTRSALLSALERGGVDAPVGEAVAARPALAEAGEPLEPVLQRLRGSGQASLPVLDGGRLVGLLTVDNVSELLLVREALRRYASQV